MTSDVMSGSINVKPGMAYCSTCGQMIAANAASCPKCGAPAAGVQSGVSTKGFVPAVLLCVLLGTLGVHRFYAGKVGTGILMLITFGGLGIWTLIDFIMIVTGNFKDGNGLPIRR